jgi:predicted restriction endonuclease
MSVSSKYGTRWSREETILALYLYCQIPFGQCDHRTPAVQELAAKIERTPSSVARKLGNLGAFDETLSARGVKGLAHTSHLDRQVWEEFHNNWPALVDVASLIMFELHINESEWLERQQVQQDDRPLLGITETEVETTVKSRRGQAFFRRTVLASYKQCCCVCNLNYPQLLIASHIVPWSIDEAARLDPRNGLSLCVLHDKLFDVGLMTIDSDLKVRLSSQLGLKATDSAESMIFRYDNQPLIRPTRFQPNPSKLEWHEQHIFVA